jgi:hypothetical protein
VARALVELWATVPAEARDDFLARARERQARLQEIGVSFWLFERPDAAGEMVQYVEARDADRLAQARVLLEIRADEREILLHQLEL